MEKTGITEIFRPGTVKSVSNRGHYFRIERGGVFFRSLELFVNQGVSRIVLTKKRNIDVRLETTKALRYVNFARARGYDLSCVF